MIVSLVHIAVLTGSSSVVSGELMRAIAFRCSESDRGSIDQQHYDLRLGLRHPAPQRRRLLLHLTAGEDVVGAGALPICGMLGFPIRSPFRPEDLPAQPDGVGKGLEDHEHSEAEEDDLGDSEGW